MRTLLAVFWLLAAAGGVPQADSITVDDIKGTDLKGSLFDGSSLKGDLVLVDFWAVWCTPCIAAFPVLKQLNTDFNERGFQVVGIAVYSGTREDVREVVNNHKLNYTVVVGDEDLVEAFGVIGIPTYFLFRSDGKLHKKYVGEVKGFYDRIRADILELQPEHN